MHEMSVAIALYRACREEVDAQGGGRLHAVCAKVGELTAIEPELLRFAWEAVTADGPDSDATLTIQWCPTSQVCSSCGTIDGRQPGTWLRLCPYCAAPLGLAGGQELELSQVTFDEAPKGVEA